MDCELLEKKRAAKNFAAPNPNPHSELHSHSHAAHAAFGFCVLDVSDHGFGGEAQAGDRRCVLQGSTRYFRGIDDTGCDEIFVLLGRGAEAV